MFMPLYQFVCRINGFAISLSLLRSAHVSPLNDLMQKRVKSSVRLPHCVISVGALYGVGDC